MFHSTSPETALMTTTPIQISYYSDILCVWAYIAERRLAELRTQFGTKIDIDYRCISIFGDTEGKFAVGWKDRGGFEAYAAHVQDVVSGFEHIEIHKDTWSMVRPASSIGVHLLIKAVQLVLDTDGKAGVERLTWGLREAFFAEAQDIANIEVQMEIIKSLGLPGEDIRQRLFDGTAFAALSIDNDAQASQKIEGSPTYVLNNERQKLYGNVGFKIIEANILELLREPSAGQASWC
jgi:predicted DsbA family dithiol-disulfide isomerase